MHISGNGDQRNIRPQDGNRKQFRYAVFFIIISSLFSALAQLLFKMEAVRHPDLTIGAILTHPLSILGMVSYLPALGFTLAAYSRGPLNTLYPITTFLYVWTIIFGKFILKEELTFGKILGITVITGGIILLGSDRHSGGSG